MDKEESARLTPTEREELAVRLIAARLKSWLDRATGHQA